MNAALRRGLAAAAIGIGGVVAIGAQDQPLQILIGGRAVDLAKVLERVPWVLDTTRDTLERRKQLQTPVRFITGAFPPIAVTPTGLQPRLTGAGRFVDALSANQKASVESATDAVGRIERKRANGTYEHIGTGFVARNGHVLTNCHVVQAVASKSNGTWRLDAGVLIDFASDGTHTPAHEFRLTAIARYPPDVGLDAAQLVVDAQSIDGTTSLPPDLRLRGARGTSAYIGDEIFVVGYPALAGYGASAPPTDPFKILSQQKVTKIASPGVLAGTNNGHGFDVLLHLASTYRGQSGSPVLDKLEGDVLGIHNCCTAAAPPSATFQVDDPPCASVLFADRENQAIAAWAAVAALKAPSPLLPGRPHR